MNKASSATGWVRNPDGTLGWTWNPITGCLNHTPEGLCLGGMFPCYAYQLANGRLRSRYLGNDNICVPITGLDGKISIEYLRARNNPFYPRFWSKRLKQPYIDCTRLQIMKGIFVCDMGELFGSWLPREWQSRVFQVIKDNPWHRFYLLTKQPQNLAKFSPFPDNCWVGVTVTKPEFLLPALDALDSIQCSVRYLSIEPMLARFGMSDLSLLLAGSVDWLIIGSQTKPYMPPKMVWVRDIVEACDKAGVPVFLKNNLKPLLPPEVPTFYTLAEPWNEVDQKPVLRQENAQWR